MIEYDKLKSGDTLKVTGKPHYNAQGRVAADKGALVQVTDVFPAGVRVKTEAGLAVEFYFEHGAEKLDYTKETKAAIEGREGFGKKEEAATISE